MASCYEASRRAGGSCVSTRYASTGMHRSYVASVRIVARRLWSTGEKHWHPTRHTPDTAPLHTSEASTDTTSVTIGIAIAHPARHYGALPVTGAEKTQSEHQEAGSNARLPSE